jgi:caa(3)-type oxidase subunit IV
VDTNNIDYKKEQTHFFKVLIGLLILTAVTFIQPHMFFTESNFAAQMFIAVIKAWLIIMYYMHLKGETLISWMAGFSLFIVFTFFAIVIGVDVQQFQYQEQSHITASATPTTEAGHKPASSAH